MGCLSDLLGSRITTNFSHTDQSPCLHILIHFVWFDPVSKDCSGGGTMWGRFLADAHQCQIPAARRSIPNARQRILNAHGGNSRIHGGGGGSWVFCGGAWYWFVNSPSPQIPIALLFVMDCMLFFFPSVTCISLICVRDPFFFLGLIFLSLYVLYFFNFIWALAKSLRQRSSRCGNSASNW